MFKKIAIIAIVITIFIGGNLIASPTPDLHVYVWAQDELTWTIHVSGQPEETHIGDWNRVRNNWANKSYYITVNGTSYVSGTFPVGGDYFITVPVEVPTNPNPEE